ncbi:hypothetical protein FC24_GL000242 [Loigolactobacillus rennini DSM 20253]|uniref:Uncharacterized protein n=1 Tax=Loigolactobacillus rennini DSM 20253 TaxID=1423796 RepID=A0A0R2CYB2_9LACO|nr:hypothetical protein FC24_GL000242 [Loigolactobacillus rennini DSM 20253]
MLQLKSGYTLPHNKRDFNGKNRATLADWQQKRAVSSGCPVFHFHGGIIAD